MECKPEDWKKGKKVFLAIISLIVAAMAILAVVLVVNNKKAPAAVPEAVPETISENGDVEFTGPEYKPSKVYDDNQKEISLQELADKPMALIFFNTSNEKSIEALEIFKKYEEEYSEKVNIIGICILDGVTETQDSVKKVLNANEININRVLFDSKYSAKKDYSVDKIPTLVFINKNKQIINTISKDEDILDDVIHANLEILAENYL